MASSGTVGTLTSMPTTRDLRWYHAEPSLLTAETVWAELPDGRPFARFHRRTTDDGRPRWHWTGGGLPDFAVEAEAAPASFLITDPNGVPFARIRQRGLLWPRLAAFDAHHERFVVELDGRIVAASDAREPLGSLDLRGPGEVWVELLAVEDPLLRTLLAAAPLCYATQAMLLRT